MKKNFSVFGINVLISILIFVFLTACGQEQQDEGAGSNVTEATTQVRTEDGRQLDTVHTQVLEETQKNTILTSDETITTTSPTVTYTCISDVCSGKLSIPLKPFTTKLALGTLPVSEYISLQNIGANMLVQVKSDNGSLSKIVNAGLKSEIADNDASKIIRVTPQVIWESFSQTSQGSINTIITAWFKDNIENIEFDQPDSVAMKLMDHLNQKLKDSPIKIVRIDFQGSIAEYVEVAVPVEK